MNLLFLTQVLPYPLDAGPKTRAYYVLRHLAQGHRVTLLSFVRETDRPGALDHLRTFCDAVHTVRMRRSRLRDAQHLARSLGANTPFLIARDTVPEMAARVRQLVGSGEFDAVHADQLWMAPYALLARDAAPPHRRPALVLDQHNAVFQIPRRLAHDESNIFKRRVLELEARKLLRYEGEVCGRFDHVAWVTREDRTALPAVTSPSTIIPICVDPHNQPPLPHRQDAHRVTFLGGLHWPPNAEGMAWFAREVWPQVQAQAPEAVLTVIGKNPPQELIELSGSHVEVTGYVGDPRPYLEETAAFIVPLHAGGGMRVKILDAWLWGLPLVTTTIGGEGIDVRDGVNALVADSPDALAAAVLDLLREPEQAAQLAAAGRATVEDQYNWHTVYRAWDTIYRGLARGAAASVVIPSAASRA